LILYYLAYCSSFSALLPVLPLFINRKSLGFQLYPIAYLILLGVFVEGVNIIMAYKGLNNNFLIGLFSFFEITLITFFYKRFFDDFFRTNMYWFLLAGFVIIGLVEAFFINDFYTMNITASVEALMGICYSLFAFYLIMKNLVFDQLLRTPFFWINTAILLYFSGTLFLFLFTTYLAKYDVKDYGPLYAIHSVVNITYYILISIGFWKAQAK
jgi:hypothetical protein